MKLSVKVLTIGTFVLLLTNTIVLSEAPSGLRGIVVDAAEYAPILHQNGTADVHVRTDEGGKYSVQLTIGVYDVLISADGFDPACRKVEIEPNGMMIFDAVLHATKIGMQDDGP